MTPVSAQLLNELPLSLPSSTSTAGRRLRRTGALARGLAPLRSQARFMPPRKLEDLAVLLLPRVRSRRIARRDFASIGGLPKRPLLKFTVAQTLSKDSVEFPGARGRSASARPGNRALMSWPPTSPSGGRDWPVRQMMEIMVVLPAPFGRAAPGFSLSRISRSTDFRA